MCVYSGGFSPVEGDYSVFAGSSKPNCVKIYEGGKSGEGEYQQTWGVSGFEKGVYSTHVAEDYKHVAIGCGDKYLTVLNINSFE